MPPESAEPMVQQFVEKADHDLAAARILANEAGLAGIVCFHCKQAVEKMLSASIPWLGT